MEPVPENIAPLVKVGEVVGRWFDVRRTDKELGSFEECLQEVVEAAVAWAIRARSAGEDLAKFTSALETEVASPRFAARAHRLFTAMLSTPSKAHRRRLAGILVAGPAAIADEARLDRLDLLITRLVDSEVVLLGRLAEFDHVEKAEAESAQGELDPVSLEALQASGCIRAVPNAENVSGGPAVHGVSLAHTGRFLLESLQLRPIHSAVNLPTRPPEE